MSDFKFVDSDPERILNEMIKDYEDAYFAITGENILLIDSDEHMAQVTALAYRFSQFSVIMDQTAKQNLIDYAVGQYLEEIGERVNTPRDPAKPAKTTLKFELTDAQQEIVSISKGTIVKSKKYFFKTDEYVEIPVGELTCTVDGSCTIEGEEANGILPGNINVIVSELAYGMKVYNTTVTQGGSEVQSNESYRLAIKAAPLTYSTAGPEAAYQALAKKFSSEILDVKASSPTPGVADLRFILIDGELPDQTMIDNLKDYLSDKTRRPLTDQLEVSAPDLVEYSIDCTYYIGSSDIDKVEDIMSKADDAKDAYIVWQKSKIKRDVDPTELISKLKAAGVKRCVVTQPLYAVVGASEVASLTTVNFVYGGIEDE